MPSLKSASASPPYAQGSYFTASAPYGSTTTSARDVFNGKQMITGPCVIKRMYFWNKNDGPVPIFLHDGYDQNAKAIIYKVGQQSQLYIDVPEPGFVMSKGVWFRHGNKSATSTGSVHCTITYEDLPAAIPLDEQGETQ